MKKITAFLFFVLFNQAIKADIIPNPIQAKGIVAKKNVNVQMVSEKVIVDLFKDSSIVECRFNMKNLGTSALVEIGFPIMSFYHFSNTVSNDTDKHKFEVWVDGEPVDKVNIYVPEELKKLTADRKTYDSKSAKELRAYETENKPWYLWETKFKKNQEMQIVVKYHLPAGAKKTNRFFNYLLSTGAGWAGKIERADIIVNLRDLPREQILKISPSNYTIENNQIMWNFKNLEPTVKDDILIDYETVKGAYEKRMAEFKAKQPVYYIDDVKMVDSEFQPSQINIGDIAGVYIKQNIPEEKNGRVSVYTRQYVFKSFLKNLESGFPEVNRQLSKETADTFTKNYMLKINDEEIDKDKEVLMKLFELDKNKVLSIELKEVPENKKYIIIKAKV